MQSHSVYDNSQGILSTGYLDSYDTGLYDLFIFDELLFKLLKYAWIRSYTFLFPCESRSQKLGQMRRMELSEGLSVTQRHACEVHQWCWLF